MADEATAEFITELLDRMSTSLREVLDRIESLNSALGRFDGQSQKASNATETLNKAMRDATGGADAASKAMGRLKDVMHGLKGGVGKKLDDFHEKWGKVQGSGFGLVEPLKDAATYDNTIRHTGRTLDIHGEALDQYVATEKGRINELARVTGQRSGALAEVLGFFAREGLRGQVLEGSLATTAKIATAYDVAPEAVAKSAFSLKESLGIDDAHLQEALASVAIAGKMLPSLPQVAASAGALGIKGSAGVHDLAAALAVARMGTATDGDAVTGVRAFLNTITSRDGADNWHKFFNKDLFKLEADARQHGQDPMMAVLDLLHQREKKDGDFSKMLSTFFKGQGERDFVTTLLKNWDKYQGIHRSVGNASQGVTDRDYVDGRKSELIQVQTFEEAMTQLEHRVEDDFMPILVRITGAINSVNAVLEKMDAVLPGFSTYLLGGVGAFLGLVAVIGAVGAVSSAVSAGFGVLAAVMGVLSWPVWLVIAGIAAVGVALYECWKHWDKIKPVLLAVGNAIEGFIHKIWDAIPSSIRSGLGWVWKTEGAALLSAASLFHGDKGAHSPASPRLAPANGAHPAAAPVAVQRLAPAVPSGRDSRIQLRIHADPGLNVRAESSTGHPLDVHTHGGLNSMMGRP